MSITFVIRYSRALKVVSCNMLLANKWKSDLTEWRVVAAPLRAAVVPSTIHSAGATVFRWRIKSANLNTCAWSGASNVVRVAAKHGHTRPKLGTSEGDHVFANAPMLVKMNR
ncbi:hypothetical protein H106_04551 [Trichophyton rubrum CBS 735.88]|nr:hypothetical protein H106_04551 [Trichophyton rubrum CBS 735.88]